MPSLGFCTATPLRESLARLPLAFQSLPSFDGLMLVPQKGNKYPLAKYRAGGYQNLSAKEDRVQCVKKFFALVLCTCLAQHLVAITARLVSQTMAKLEQRILRIERLVLQASCHSLIAPRQVKWQLS